MIKILESILNILFPNVLIITRERELEITMRLAANYIIATDALTNADFEPKKFCDGVNRITDNTMRITAIIGGARALNDLDDLVNKKQIYKR